MFHELYCSHDAIAQKSLGNQHVSVVRFLLHIMISYLTLTLLSAVRYCGATFTFTSVSILLNYSTWSDLSLASLWGSKSACLVTPPPIIGLANGVAQSIVSLARGFGPLLGGYVNASPLLI